MVLVLLGTLALAGAAELKWVLPAETSRLQAAPGRELADARCLVCHSADYISTQPRFNRGQWQATVLKMQQKYGAVVSTNESKTLVDYLVKSYGAETPANNSVPRR